MITNDQKESIAIEVIRTLYSQFEKFPDDATVNRNAPFHEAFLKAFPEKLEGMVQSVRDLISLASWMHGLNTSLGQSFLEQTAHILCNGSKKAFTKKEKSNLKISKAQRDIVHKIITDLTNDNRKPNLDAEDRECNATSQTLEVEADDFTVDVFFEDAENVICIELKTVKPNKGIFKVEKAKVLEATLALKNKYPNKRVKYFLGFPFDPLSETPTGYDKSRYMDYSVDFRKYFSEEQFLLSAELWDFLSDTKHTMETILEIISKIATPRFKDIYDFLNNSENIKTQTIDYANHSRDWYLYSNEFITRNLSKLPEKIYADSKFQRIFNQTLFSNDTRIRKDRIQFLLNTIKENVK